MGLNFNLHGSVSSEFAENYFPKSEELKLTVSFPHLSEWEFPTREAEARVTQPCLRLLEEVLKRGYRLKTLDLSKIWVADSKFWVADTGLLLLQNVKQLFCTTHQ